jgi:hypothetical protein
MGPGPLSKNSPSMSFLTLFMMVKCSSLYVCVIGLRGFHHQEKLTLGSLCWLEEKILASLSLSVGRRDHHGLSCLLLVVIY